jgi:chromosome segregation ATPase
MKSEEAENIKDKKERNKIGDRKYKEAWREWQDSYFNEVSIACGLTRIGSHSRRLSRKEKKQEQQQAKSLSKALNETSRYVSMKKAEAEDYKEKIIKEAREQADKILREADQQITEKKKVLSDIKKEIKEHETKLERLTNKPLLQKIFDKFRSEGFKQAERELKESYKSEIDSLSSELEDTKNQISRLNQYTLKLSSEKSKMETENNKLNREVSELKTELNKYNIDTSPTASYGSRFDT